MTSNPDKPDAAIVVTTAGGKDEAKKLAEGLLTAKLAACIQFIPIESYFFWEGEVQNEGEILLLIKCRETDYQEIQTKISELHSYDVPEILKVDVDAGLPAYTGWITEVTSR